jgi:hypothetical protein
MTMIEEKKAKNWGRINWNLKQPKSTQFVGEVELADVLDFCIPAGTIFRKEYYGLQVDMDSTKYFMFKNKGIICVECGVIGYKFMLELPRLPKIKIPYFNLYTDCGTLMTQDHIYPKSKGGLGTIENLQPMCSHCNNRKSDNILV